MCTVPTLYTAVLHSIQYKIYSFLPPTMWCTVLYSSIYIYCTVYYAVHERQCVVEHVVGLGAAPEVQPQAKLDILYKIAEFRNVR